MASKPAALKAKDEKRESQLLAKSINQWRKLNGSGEA
jgi:hypothetical protein